MVMCQFLTGTMASAALSRVMAVSEWVIDETVYGGSAHTASNS